MQTKTIVGTHEDNIKVHRTADLEVVVVAPPSVSEAEVAQPSSAQ